MVLFNYATKELTAKVVYYGPGLCGKTTNLQFIHQNLPDSAKGKMLSLATKTDRTLFFDFLPLNLGEIRGMKTRVQLYTVPGQVFYNETRKLVLKGVDGVVFVADSQKEMLGPNAESLKNLEENLRGHGLSLKEIAHVIQFNKRDLPKLASVEEINASLNKYNAPFYECVASTGIGVKDTLNAITKLVLVNLTKKYGSSSAAQQPAVAAPVSVAVGSPTPAPAVAAAAASVQPAAAVSVGPTDAFPPESPASSYKDSEIDALVGEVETSTAPTPPAPPAPPVPIEIDMPSAAPPVLPAELSLTEAASDDDLFNDPNLAVSRLATGVEQQIEIPIEVGDSPQATRRYRLSLKLRLDPVD